MKIIIKRLFFKVSILSFILSACASSNQSCSTDKKGRKLCTTTQNDESVYNSDQKRMAAYAAAPRRKENEQITVALFLINAQEGVGGPKSEYTLVNTFGNPYLYRLYIDLRESPKLNLLKPIEHTQPSLGDSYALQSMSLQTCCYEVNMKTVNFIYNAGIKADVYVFLALTQEMARDQSYIATDDHVVSSHKARFTAYYLTRYAGKVYTISELGTQIMDDQRNNDSDALALQLLGDELTKSITTTLRKECPDLNALLKIEGQEPPGYFKSKGKSE